MILYYYDVYTCKIYLYMLINIFVNATALTAACVDVHVQMCVDVCCRLTLSRNELPVPKLSFVEGSTVERFYCMHVV